MALVANIAYDFLTNEERGARVGKTSKGQNWRYIPVRGGYKAKIDREDYARVAQFNWYKTTAKSGRMTVIANLKTARGFRLTTLGKFLMNPPRGKFVYPRRFMNGFDYRKENLVICTMAERQQMLPKSHKQGSSSHYKGVSYSKQRNCWRAGIQYKGKSITLGLFTTEVEAAQAYNKAAQKYFGDFAYYNQTTRKVGRRRSDPAKK